MAGGFVGVLDPDLFGTEYTPTWLLVTQAGALAILIMVFFYL